MLEKDMNYLKELKENMKIKIRKYNYLYTVNCVIGDVVKIKENGVVFYFEEIDIEETKKININFFMKDKIKELEILGKPIVHCKELKAVKKDFQLQNRIFYLVNLNSIHQVYYTKYLEEKEGILITDDFIFIKD